MYGKSEWKIEGMNSKNELFTWMLYLAHGKIRKFKFKNFRWHFEWSWCCKITKLFHLHWNNSWYCSYETGLLKTRFLETLRLGEDKVKLACSLFSFNLFVKLFYFFFYFATLLTYWNCSVPLQHRHDIFEFIVTFVKTSTLR